MWKVDLESVINLESVSKLAYASKSQLISKGLFDDTKKSFWNYMTFTDLSTNVLSCFSWNIESLHEQYDFFWTFGLSKLGATWGTTLAATWPFDCVIFGYWETWLTLSMLNMFKLVCPFLLLKLNLHKWGQKTNYKIRVILKIERT